MSIVWHTSKILSSLSLTGSSRDLGSCLNKYSPRQTPCCLRLWSSMSYLPSSYNRLAQYSPCYTEALTCFIPIVWIITKLIDMHLYQLFLKIDIYCSVIFSQPWYGIKKGTSLWYFKPWISCCIDRLISAVSTSARWTISLLTHWVKSNFICIQLLVYVQLYASVCLHMHIIYMCMYIQTFVRAYIFTCPWIYIYSCMHLNTHEQYTSIRTHARVYKQIYMYIFIGVYVLHIDVSLFVHMRVWNMLTF